MLDAPRSVRRWILGDIDLVYRLHGVRRVILVHHEDCAAYGGSVTLGTVAQQRRFHRAQLQRAARMLRREFPGLSVSGFLAYGYPVKIQIIALK